MATNYAAIETMETEKLIDRFSELAGTMSELLWYRLDEKHDEEEWKKLNDQIKECKKEMDEVLHRLSVY